MNITNRIFTILLTLSLSVLASAQPMPPVLQCDGAECQPTNSGPGFQRYSFAGYDLPFSIAWPEVPQISSTVSVSTIGELQSAVQQSNIQINVAPGTYRGNVTISGTDVDVVASSGTRIEGEVVPANGRVRWTGGLIDNNGAPMTWRSISDVLFDNVTILGGIVLHENGSTACHRIAIINSEIDTRASSTTQFSIYSNPDQGAGRHSDFIFANLRVHNAVNSPFRIEYTERVVVLESAFNGHESSGTGFRFSTNTNNAYVGGRAGKPTIIVQRQHYSYTNFGNAAVTNATWDNVIQYRDFPQFSTNGSLQNSGTVRNYTLYAMTGAGQSVDFGPFANAGGIPTAREWDGSTLPDISGYGPSQ